MRLSLILAAALLCGCGGCLKDGSSAVSSTTVSVGSQPSTGTWSIGVTITFKEAPPSPQTVVKLQMAGAERIVGSEQWVISRYERLDQKQSRAIEASLREGAVLKGTK